MHDVIIIGGGPAGLSAALNGAAEGLNTLLLERAPVLGGQAGTTSLIENYLGFPNGVAGEPLTRKAVKQARRLGADIRTSHAVVAMEHNEATGTWLTTCERDTRHVSRTVILAVGVDYRQLPDSVDPLHRALYGAPASAHEECRGRDVVVIGGGNSAGQAAVNLSKIGARVTLLVRRPLKHTMSRYLIEKVAIDPNIDARIGSVGAIKEQSIQPEDDVFEDIPADVVFAYIGMTPRTTFVEDCCTIHPPGFVPTDDQFRATETGLFVAGDVREGSFKRVAAAVGEGAIAAAAAWRHIYTRED